MEEVPRRTSLAPLASPCFLLCLIGVETEGLLDYQGRAGIISIVRWNLRPVIFGVDIIICLPFPSRLLFRIDMHPRLHRNALDKALVVGVTGMLQQSYANHSKMCCARWKERQTCNKCPSAVYILQASKAKLTMNML